MAPGFPAGVSRRFMQEEERTILCDLGYHVNDHFGSLADGVLANEVAYDEVCGGMQVVGWNDGIDEDGNYLFTSYDGEPVNISGDQLLMNDFAPGTGTLTFECLEVILGTATLTVNGSSTATSGNSSATIVLQPAYSGGMFMLRYVPVKNGMKGNITYVFLNSEISVSFIPNNYYQQDACSANVCNLINNGGFEEDAEWCSHRCRTNSDGADNITCWEAYGAPLVTGAIFTRNVVNINGYDCGFNDNVYCRPANATPAAGINSNTRSFPATDTHPNSTTVNNAMVFLGGHYVDPNIQSAEEYDATRFRTFLNAPLVPGAQYVLSYYGKAFKSNLDPNQTTHLNEGVVGLYDLGNVPAIVRFLIDNNEESLYEINPNPGNNTSIIPGFIILAEPDPIPPVGPDPTPTSDWHYREVIVTIPESLTNDYQFLTIDYNIWDTPYAEIITGVFIDDVSLRPYYGPVVDLPETACLSGTINDLHSFVTAPVNGTFTCPTCAPGSIGIDGNSFNAYIAGPGEHQIIFTYSTAQGCEISQSEMLLVDETGCCDMSISIDEVVANPCPQGEQGKAFITVTNGSSNVVYDWNGPTTSTQEDPQDLASGTYELTVTDGNCIASATVIIPELTPLAIPTITSQTDADLYLNGQVLNVLGELEINTNSINGIDISDCSLFFSSTGTFIVNENSEIGLDNMLLDACDASWDGIVLLSTQSTTAAGGRIKLGNNLVIKHARIGIRTADAVTSSFLDLFDCGSVHLVNTQFVDNKQALNVARGKSSGSIKEMFFENCSFIWTDDVVNHFPNMWGNVTNSTPLNYMVYLLRYKGAKFTDCVFENSATTNSWNVRGRGIKTIDARITVKSSDSNSPSSLFRGFNIGVDLTGSQSMYALSVVQDNVFEKNKVGINQMNHFSNRLNRNTIHVGMPTDINLLDNSLTKYEGIHLQNTTGFEVSENHIFGYLDGLGSWTDDNLPYTVGITTASTGSSNEEIYNNDLHDLNWASVANGLNAPQIGDGGLRYVCNTNFGNNNDFVVADFPTTSGAQIGEVQTDYPTVGTNEEEKAAGNTFTQGNTNDNNDFWNATQSPNIVYRRYIFGTNETPALAYSFGIAIESKDQNFCTPELTLFNSPDGTLNQSTIQNWQTFKNASRTEWLNTRYIWKSLIDGGSTEELQSEIENAYSGTTWVERQKLLDYSPYLTHTVLTEVADNTLVFPHPVALEIFLANPDVLTDKPFMDHLSLKADPMPEYMIDILKNSSDQTTARTILEDELREKQSIYLDAAQKIFRARLDDSTFTIEDQLEEMKQWKNLSTEYQIIEHYMEIGDHETALERYSQIPEICDLNREGNRDFELFYEWLNLKRAIFDDDQYMESLSGAFIQQLQLLADSYPYSYAGGKAMLVLNDYYEGEYVFEPFVPFEPASTKSLKNSKSEVKLDLIRIFPDPASNLLNIQLHIPEAIFKSGQIKILDMNGKLITQMQVHSSNQQYCLDVSSWSVGAYQVILFNESNKVESKSIHVIR
jgi:hypothetical protein